MKTEEVFEELRKIVAETERIFTVYKHTDPEGKVYIGYCCGNWKKRWKSGSGYHTNKRFHEAIRHYGPGNFTHEVIADNLTFPEALELERKMILQYDSTNPQHQSGEGLQRGAACRRKRAQALQRIYAPLSGGEDLCRIHRNATDEALEKRKRL